MRETTDYRRMMARSQNHIPIPKGIPLKCMKSLVFCKKMADKWKTMDYGHTVTKFVLKVLQNIPWIPHNFYDRSGQIGPNICDIVEKSSHWVFVVCAKHFQCILIWKKSLSSFTLLCRHKKRPIIGYVDLTLFSVLFLRLWTYRNHLIFSIERVRKTTPD